MNKLYQHQINMYTSQFSCSYLYGSLSDTIFIHLVEYMYYIFVREPVLKAHIFGGND